MPLRGIRTHGPYGLRARLTVTYVVFFSLLLLGLGILFRQTLQANLYDSTASALDDEWVLSRTYLHVANDLPEWHYDLDDTEEAFMVNRLQRIFLLANKDGRVLQVSDAYSFLGVEPADELRRMLRDRTTGMRVRQDREGISYLIRTGIMTGSDKQDYLLMMGRRLDTNQGILDNFTRAYFTFVPAMILGITLLGWLLAGRALQPLKSVATTARAVTGETLGVRIERRGAGDELDQLIDDFNSMVDRLEGSFNQIRRFSIDVSHELRTPLTAMRGELEVALMSAKTVEQYREAMVCAIEDVERLGQIVRALLQLSQAESGQVTLVKEKLDLSALTEAVVENYQIPAEINGVDLKANVEDGCLVEGDRIQLERMITNLLSNAVKYTPGGGKVTVAVRKAGPRVELEIQDTGCGIPAEHLPRIFERLYRVPDGNAPDPDRGMGLGLSFVAWIAKVHNAKIDVQSTPGAGATFRVHLAAAV